MIKVRILKTMILLNASQLLGDDGFIKDSNRYQYKARQIDFYLVPSFKSAWRLAA